MNIIKLGFEPFSLLPQLIQQLQTPSMTQGGVTSTLLIIAIFIIAIWGVLKASKLVLETVVSIVESLKKLGLSYILQIEIRSLPYVVVSNFAWCYVAI